MNPNLVAILGPLQGQSFNWEDPEVTIGRESSNWIALNDSLVSRRHCLLKKENRRFQILDLDSRNGTSVNGFPIRQRVLMHGDQIQIGDSLFLFLLQKEEETPSEDAFFSEESWKVGSTVRIRSEETIYLKPDQITALPPNSRTTRGLNTLLKISTSMNATQGVEALQTELLELVVEALPAERAVLMILEPGFETNAVRSIDKRGELTQQILVNRSIVDQVLKEGVGILGSDIEQSRNLNDSNIFSFLCVPLSLPNKILGVLYLDTSDANLPFDENDLQLLTAVANIAAVAVNHEQEREWLFQENQRLRSDTRVEHNMIGESAAIRKVFEFIEPVARSNATVLIRGESGTGKELVAQAIHLNSPRASKPFVAISCAALAESLLESELFGHEKGAFTGAIAQKKGKLELADCGSVFLDEVGEIPATLQAKLLRVLQEREFERLGGRKPIKIDVRWIAATNKGLEEAMESGLFRQDLYFRLNVVPLTIPPLRERREDIPLLANYFLAKFNKNQQKRIKIISPEARKYLMDYDWPGNIRELQNVMEYAVVLASTDQIIPEDLPENMLLTESSNLNEYHRAIKQTKKDIVLRALQRSGGDYNEAARLLGLHPVYLYRLVRNLNLKESR